MATWTTVYVEIQMEVRAMRENGNTDHREEFTDPIKYHSSRIKANKLITGPAFPRMELILG